MVDPARAAAMARKRVMIKVKVKTRKRVKVEVEVGEPSSEPRSRRNAILLYIPPIPLPSTVTLKGLTVKRLTGGTSMLMPSLSVYAVRMPCSETSFLAAPRDKVSDVLERFEGKFGGRL